MSVLKQAYVINQRINNYLNEMYKNSDYGEEIFIVPDNKNSYITSFKYSYIMRNEKKISERLLISFKNGKVVEYWDYKPLQPLFEDIKKYQGVFQIFWLENIFKKLHYKIIR